MQKQILCCVPFLSLVCVLETNICLAVAYKCIDLLERRGLGLNLTLVVEVVVDVCETSNTQRTNGTL